MDPTKTHKPNLLYNPSGAADSHVGLVPSRWTRDHECICKLYCPGRRIEIITSVKAHVARAGYGNTIGRISQIQAADLADAVLHVGKAGSTKKAMRNLRIPPAVVESIKSLSISTARVIGTEAHRAYLRQVRTHYRVQSSPNSLFVAPSLSDA